MGQAAGGWLSAVLRAATECEQSRACAPRRKHEARRGLLACAGLRRVSQPRCGVAMQTKWQGDKPATVRVEGLYSRPTA